MTKTEAEALGDELWDLVKQGPGRNESGLRRVAEIESALLYDPNTSPYIREKVRTAAMWFGYWFTPKRWQRWGEDQMRSNLTTDVYKVKLAIGDDWSDDSR